MIVFDLRCTPHGHRFEGWFGSSSDFGAQQERGLVTCPICGSSDVAKAPMAPAVPRKGNQRDRTPAAKAPAAGGALPPEAAAMMQALAKLQGEMVKRSRWVGDDFAEQTRAIHYGERDAETIHGEATADEARELLDEGIAIVPLPFPVVPPEQAN